jgi:hypothetical protein
MRLVENQTNADGFQYVKFVPRTTQASYLRIFSGSGCWSYVSLIFVNYYIGKPFLFTN